MKPFPLVIFLSISSLLIGISCSSYNGQPPSMRIMSYNIKYDDQADTVNGWDLRKEQVVNLIRFHEPDFMGTQEGLLRQLEYMEKELGNMKWIGVGRTDGKNEGEFSALYYNTNRFELIANTDSTIWLSNTPGQPSKSWDAALPRILTWGKFRDRKSDKEFYVFNTHFDHIGDTARAESARLIIDTIETVAGNFPVILTGDFNVTEESEPYAVLTGSDLRDAFNVSNLPHVGPLFSFEGFNVLGSASKRRIDYIFVDDHVKVLKHAIISDFRDGRYPSDHLPVITDILLQ